jgi:hypothetical protein
MVKRAVLNVDVEKRAWLTGRYKAFRVLIIRFEK